MHGRREIPWNPSRNAGRDPLCRVRKRRQAGQTITMIHHMICTSRIQSPTKHWTSDSYNTGRNVLQVRHWNPIAKQYTNQAFTIASPGHCSPAHRRRDLGVQDLTIGFNMENIQLKFERRFRRSSINLHERTTVWLEKVRSFLMIPNAILSVRSIWWALLDFRTRVLRTHPLHFLFSVDNDFSHHAAEFPLTDKKENTV